MSQGSAIILTWLSSRIATERMLLVDVVAFVAYERGRQIEAETVHAHLGHPITQRIQYQPEHARLGGVDGVTAAGDVVVVALVVGQPVVAEMVDAAEGERRALVAAFTGVVETTSRITSMPAACSLRPSP
jgi:hypothetical protein